MSGYSGKSLSQKLGLKSGMNAIVLFPPDGYLEWLEEDRNLIRSKSSPPWDFVHLFANQLSLLEDHLADLRNQIKPNGIIWVSWYKKSAKKPTEITEDLIRDTCLPLGLVDIKVCAVSDDWSGLKLVIRQALRSK